VNTPTRLKTGELKDFFEEGREIARLADAGQPVPEVRTITFESIEDLLEYLTPKRVALFEAIRSAPEPESITMVAMRVGRDRAAVKRDIDALQQVGIVAVTEVTLPGHGRQKLVRPLAQKVVLNATL
jgi:predicted transcriptional regulator